MGNLSALCFITLQFVLLFLGNPVFCESQIELTATDPVSVQDVEAERQLIELIRLHLNTSKLPYHPLLAKVSKMRAQEMADLGILSHRDDEGKGPAERWAKAGGTRGLIGEIIGSGSQFEDIITGWLNSPPHNSVLRGKEWISFGLGVARLNQVWVVVVLFLGS